MAALTRKLGGWQVISWALIIALPFMVVAALLTMPASLHGTGFSGWGSRHAAA